MISLKEAENFHGHLGPWLVLGLLAGEAALKKIKARKYFKLKVKVWGANQKPKSCLIDGLQLSTGATYGKGNIQKIASGEIKIICHNLENNKKIKILLCKDLMKKIGSLKGHHDSEAFARKLYRAKPINIFHLTTGE